MTTIETRAARQTASEIRSARNNEADQIRRANEHLAAAAAHLARAAEFATQDRAEALAGNARALALVTDGNTTMAAEAADDLRVWGIGGSARFHAEQASAEDQRTEAAARRAEAAAGWR